MSTDKNFNDRLIINETVILANKKKYSAKKIILCILGVLLVVSGLSVAIYLIWNEREEKSIATETDKDKNMTVDIEKQKTKEIKEIPRTKEIEEIPRTKEIEENSTLKEIEEKLNTTKIEETSIISSNPETTFEDDTNKTLEEEEKNRKETKDTATEDKSNNSVVENTDTTTPTQSLESNNILFKTPLPPPLKDVALSVKPSVENVTVDCELFWHKFKYENVTFGMKTLDKAIDLKYNTHAFYKDLIELDLSIFTDATIKTLKLNNEEYEIVRMCFDGNRLNTNSIRLKKNNIPKYILHRRNITLFIKDKTFKLLLRNQDVSNKDNNYKANNLFWSIPSYISCIAENNKNYLVLTEILEEKVDLPLAQKIELILRAMEYYSGNGMYFINLSYNTVKFYKHNSDIRPLITKTMLKQYTRKVDDLKNFSISSENVDNFDEYLYKLSNLFYMMALKHYEGKNSNTTGKIYRNYYAYDRPIFYKNTDLQVVRLIISMRFGSKIKLTQFNRLRQMLLAEMKPEIKEKYENFCTIDA